jgi:hypothetical protein
MASATTASICGSLKLFSHPVSTGAELVPRLVHWSGTWVVGGSEFFTVSAVDGGFFTAQAQNNIIVQTPAASVARELVFSFTLSSGSQ